MAHPALPPPPARRGNNARLRRDEGLFVRRSPTNRPSDRPSDLPTDLRTGLLTYLPTYSPTYQGLRPGPMKICLLYSAAFASLRPTLQISALLHESVEK